MKHVGQTDTQLSERLKAEPNIPAASTFKSLEDAESLVSKSLASRQQEITNFLLGTKKKHIIREQSNQAVGLSFLRDASEAVPVNKFLLVLIRKPEMPDGYLLLTGFPIKT